jgi:uncharacterized phage infection (PIP) family protein YhgE
MLPKVEIKRRQASEKYLVSTLIPVSLEKLSKLKPKINEKIIEIYKESVGKEISEVTSVVKFQNGELTIKAKSAVWKNELTFRGEEIKNLINSNKNKHFVVDKIIFR